MLVICMAVRHRCRCRDHIGRQFRASDMHHRVQAAGRFGKNAEMLRNACLGNPFVQIVGDILHLAIDVGVGPVD